MGRWKEGLMFQGINPTPGLGSAANWFPPTEEVGPDELRMTFMGSARFLRPGQMNTSIFIELGNGDNFVFDIGEGSVANYISAGLALNQLDKIFITHLPLRHPLAVLPVPALAHVGLENRCCGLLDLQEQRAFWPPGPFWQQFSPR